MNAARTPWTTVAAASLARHRAILPDEPGALLPRLVAYTREDKAAKGLRSLRAPKDVPETPIHFTALEMIQEERALLSVSELLHGTDLGVVSARAEAGDIEEVDVVLRRLIDGLSSVSDHLTHRYFSHAVVRAS